MKPVKAWAVLTKESEQRGHELIAWKDGWFWHLPVFHSRSEAIRWRDSTGEDILSRGLRIVRVVISEVKK